MSGMEGDSSSHADAVHTTMCHVTAQPAEAHHIITTLSDRSVITYGQASYEQVSWLDAKKCFDVNGHHAQALFAARILTSASDSLATMIEAAAKREQGLPMYRKGRVSVHRNGTFIHVAELGLPGHGQRSGNVVRDMQWMDTNNYEAAADAAPATARFLRNVTGLIVLGQEDPIRIVQSIADRTGVKHTIFNDQAARLQAHYVNGKRILCAAELLEKVYAGPTTFKAKLALVRTEGGRKQIRDEAEKLGEEIALHVRDYDLAIASIRYTPHTVQTFELTTPDYNGAQGLTIEKYIYKTYRPRTRWLDGVNFGGINLPRIFRLLRRLLASKTLPLMSNDAPLRTLHANFNDDI
jgi:hypothetical protein